jgi:hypothetical protein
MSRTPDALAIAEFLDGVRMRLNCSARVSLAVSDERVGYLEVCIVYKLNDAYRNLRQHINTSDMILLDALRLATDRMVEQVHTVIRNHQESKELAESRPS